MARVISEKTHSSITKLLKDSLKNVTNPKVKSHLKLLLEDLENSESALGYDD